MKQRQDTSQILNAPTSGLLNFSGYSAKHIVGNSSVYLVDCMVMLKQTPNKFYDLCIVDPPYGIGNNHNHLQAHKKHGTYKNNSIPGPEYFIELKRISKRTIIWGCQYFIEQLNYEGSFIVWDKKADPDIHNMSSCDVAWYSKRERIKTFHGHWCGAVKFTNDPTIHVHQKPTELYKWLLKNYAKPGDKILDTHLGSGSSRIAAYDMGFDFTGYELDKDYFDASVKRFEQFRAQTKLFA